MKRHISLLLCALLLVTLMFVACDKGSDTPAANTHQHTYGDVWSMDETNHWHAASCKDGADCANAKASLNAHADADKNSICDVCGYDFHHTHTYAAEWSSDENNHWYAVTCGCSIDVKDQAAHKDADNDGACDICEYDGGHEHTYITDAWAMDADNHWHAASCGHSVIEDEEAHDYDDMDRCVVCGYIKGSVTVDKAVDMGEYYDNLVNGGHVDFEYDTWMKYQLAIDYALGANSSNIIENNLTYAETTTYWYMLYKGSMFGIEEYADGSVGKAYEPASALIDGYAFAQVFGDDDDAEDTFYGVTALITGLYEMAKANPNGDFKEYMVSHEGTPYYVFSFSQPILYDDTVSTLYQVQVGFALGEDYTYRHVYVSSAKYNCEIDENGTTYHTTNLVPNTVYNYVVEQTSGKRDLESKYTPENIFVTDYELYEELGSEDVFDENGEWIGTKPILATTPLGDEITFEAGKPFSLCFVNILPDTAIIDLDNVIVEYEGGESSYWGGSIMLFGCPQGTYTLTIKTAMTTKTLTVIVTPPAVTEIYPTVSENGVFADKSEHTVYVDETGAANITFSAGVNTYADGSFTATLETGAQNATLIDNGDGTYTLSATATGTWVITLTSMKNPEISCTLTLTAAELPTYDVKDVLSGKYEVKFFGMTAYSFTFHPIAADGTAGTVTVVDNNNTGWSGTYDYLYEAGKLTYSNVDGIAEIPFYLDAALGTFSWNNVPTFTIIHTEAAPPVVGEELDGKYQVNFLMDGLYVLTFQNGILTVEDYNNGSYAGTYTYTGSLVNGLTVYNEDGSESDMIIALGLDGSPTFQCAGLMMPQTLIKVEDEDNDEGNDEAFNGKYSVDFLMPGLYVLTFENGVLTIEDHNNGAYSGTYSYEGTPTSGMTIYHADGTVSDILISVGLDGSFTFQCSALMMAQPLNKVEDGGDVGGDTQDALVLGNNSIVVDDPWNGVVIGFTATEAGTYVLSADHGENNAFVLIETMYGSEMLDLPYTFELGAGETMMFIILTGDFTSDTVDLVVTKEGGSGDEPADNLLVLGENSVHVQVVNFWPEWTEMVFTAPWAGTFTISPAAGESNADIYDFDGNWIENMPYTFTLAEGESIIFYFASLDMMIDEDYIDVVISEGGSQGGDEPADNLLVLGENSIHVQVVNFWPEWTEMVFTAPWAGTFTISPAAGESNADIYDFNGNWIENMPYTFTLAEGESIIFYFASLDAMIDEDYIDVVISEGGSQGGDEPADNLLVLGENSIHVQVLNFWPEWTEMVFTAPWAGTFTISPAAGESNADIYDFNGNWIENMPYTFTLAEGESIIFYFASLDMMIDEDYIDVVISEGGDEPGEQPGEGTDEPELPADATLVLGENSVYVTVTNFFQNQTKATFTAPWAGTYTISWADGETNGDLFDAWGNWIENMPYTFELEEGESIIVYVQSADFFITEDYIDLVIAEGEGEVVPEDPGVMLLPGENTVYVTVTEYFQDMIKAFFTAPVSGTYTISWADGETNGWLHNANLEWIETLPYTFTLEAGESIVFYFQSIDYMITEDYINVVISGGSTEPEQPVEPDEDDTLWLDGEYRVDFSGTTYYKLIFRNDTMTLVDNNAQLYSGTYTYQIDADGAFTFYKDGVVTTDVLIQVAPDGSYTFQCPSLKIPMALVKYEEPVDDGTETVTKFSIGDNAIKVTNGWKGVSIPFTAPSTGTYILAPAEGEENAAIIIEDGYVTELIVLNAPYVFELEEGQTKVFIVVTQGKNADTINLILTAETAS